MATILVVDDRPSNRQFLTTLLGYGGHRMLEAADGAQALELVRAQRPDLVITDILMPTMDGYEFVQQVRADPGVAPTPVIFYTATYSTPQAETLAKTCGVATVLAKPCEPQVILAAVNKALGIRDPGAGEPPALAHGRAVPRAQSADDTLTLYLRDLQEVQHNFEDLVKRSAGQGAERDSVKELSKKFAENVATMQRITSRLSALLEVGMEMMKERDPKRLVELFFAAICDIVDSKYAAIGMLDESEQAVRHVFARGLDAELFRGEAGRSGLLGTILSGERTLRARGANGARSAAGLPKGHPPVRDLLAIPVASADRTYGWMYFADKRGEEGFTEEDTRLATAMTTRLALLYENAVLYDEIQRHAADLQIEMAGRRKAQVLLVESEAGLRHSQRMARLAHVVTGPEGAFETWSETLPELIGVDAARLPRTIRAWLELLVHPDDQARFREAAIEAGVKRSRQEMEYRLRRSDGGWIHIRQTMEPLVEIAAGGRQRWFNTLLDVTEQKRAEEAIRLAELNYRSIFENTVEGIYRVDQDGKAVAANPALVRILGYASHEEMTAAITNIAYQVYADPEARKAYRKLLRDKGIVSGFETQWLRKDGSRVWVSLSGRRVQDPVSGATYYLGTAADITEQKTAAEEQRSGKQLLDNIVENIPTAVQLKSVEDGYRVVMWNKAAEAMYGLPREEAIGRNVHDLWPKADADRLHASDLELAASGEMQDFPDRPTKTKNRGVIHVHMRKVALSDADGKATHLLVIADDMTAQLADQARLRESEARFRSLSMLSSDWFWEQDEEHRFVRFSGGEGVKGWGPDQTKAIGLHRWDLGGVVPISCSWEEHKGLLDAHKPFRNFEYQRILADSRLQYVEASGEPIFDAAGRFTGYRGVATEITQRKGAENRIRRLNRVYAVLSGINALIVRVRDREELFREACRIAVETGGFLMAWLGVVDREAMTVKPVAWHGTDADYIQSMPVGIEGDVLKGRGLSGRAVKERKAMIVDDMATDARIALKQESLARGFRSLVILPLLVAEEAVGVLALYAGEIGFFDQEEMKLLEELAGDIAFAIDHIDKASKLDYLAYYDVLTGLANRTHFHESLSQHVEAARRGGHKLAVLVLDIDRFKSINDSHGRDAGDELLRQVAQRMRGVADDPGSLARISADRFAMVRPNVPSEDEVARHNERKLEECFGTPYRVAGTELRLSARVGIAMFPADGSDADTLLTNAEAALKKAKASGERSLFYTQEMTERVAEKLALENKLRQALEKEEFVLHYQPKVDLETRSIVGVEALIRWQSPELGLVPPLKFIPLLEETGLILEVGAWALKRAVRDHRGWVEQGLKAPRVAVNVSPIQLRQRDFVDVVKQAIGGSAAEAGIDLEITESLIMENIQENISKLNAVRALGIEIAIDDFGTGYSSLAYLARLPVKTLKIDRSFVVTMLKDPDSTLLVQTMISLAHSLRLKVVAEGVELEEQAKVLRLLRCDEMQGYLYSKPLPLDGITALLRERGSRA